MLISSVLAHAEALAAERRAAPIVLLDEVAAHLDELRRDALFETLCAFGAQAWLTGTDARQFAMLGGRAQFFTVRDGMVTDGGAQLMMDGRGNG
jgi:DNA replication and repair protein RecF